MLIQNLYLILSETQRNIIRWVNKRSILCVIAIVWILAALISFVPISLDLHRAGQGEEEPPPPNSLPQCALDLSPTYAIVSSCVSFYLPCIVMVGIYARLYLYARKHVKNIKAVTRQFPRPEGRTSASHSSSAYQVSRGVEQWNDCRKWVRSMDPLTTCSMERLI